MDHHSMGQATQSDALVLAIDESSRSVGLDLCRHFSTEWPLLVVSQTGKVLRYMRGFQPRVLFICLDPQRIEEIATLIAELNRRRGTASLLALAAVHEAEIERAARMAGATYYFALDSEADLRLLRRTLEELGIVPAIAAHSGLPPPRTRDSPARLLPSSRRPSAR